jgi:hypothetical protein
MYTETMLSALRINRSSRRLLCDGPGGRLRVPRPGNLQPVGRKTAAMLWIALRKRRKPGALVPGN